MSLGGLPEEMDGVEPIGGLEVLRVREPLLSNPFRQPRTGRCDHDRVQARLDGREDRASLSAQAVPEVSERRHPVDGFEDVESTSLYEHGGNRRSFVCRRVAERWDA